MRLTTRVSLFGEPVCPSREGVLTAAASSSCPPARRKTLAYAVAELQKDIDILESQQTEEQRKVTPKTQLGIFVVHNKSVPAPSLLPSPPGHVTRKHR
jgi:hypothetical protein